MMDRNRTPAQRAIIYGMALSGASNEAINQALIASGTGPLPEASYRSIMKDYVPYFRSDMTRLGKALYAPPTWTQLKAAALV